MWNPLKCHISCLLWSIGVEFFLDYVAVASCWGRPTSSHVTTSVGSHDPTQTHPKNTWASTQGGTASVHKTPDTRSRKAVSSDPSYSLDLKLIPRAVLSEIGRKCQVSLIDQNGASWNNCAPFQC